MFTDLNISIARHLQEFNKLSGLEGALESYDEEDWRDKVRFKKESYNRILLSRQDRYEIYLLCWKKNQKSHIHDHPENGCLLKVLNGALEERRFNVDPLDKTVKIISTKILDKDSISYLEGDQIVHQIWALEDSVTLHIYSPPGHHYNSYKL